MRYLRELGTVAGVLDLRRLFEDAMVEFGKGARNYTDTYNSKVKGELIIENPPYARKLTPWAKEKLVDLEGEARATKDEKNVADELADIYRSLCNEVHFMVPSKIAGLRCSGKFPLRAASALVFLFAQEKHHMNDVLLYGEDFENPSGNLIGGNYVNTSPRNK